VKNYAAVFACAVLLGYRYFSYLMNTSASAATPARDADPAVNSSRQSLRRRPASDTDVAVTAGDFCGGAESTPAARTRSLIDTRKPPWTAAAAVGTSTSSPSIGAIFTELEALAAKLPRDDDAPTDWNLGGGEAKRDSSRDSLGTDRRGSVRDRRPNNSRAPVASRRTSSIDVRPTVDEEEEERLLVDLDRRCRSVDNDSPSTDVGESLSNVVQSRHDDDLPSAGHRRSSGSPNRPSREFSFNVDQRLTDSPSASVQSLVTLKPPPQKTANVPPQRKVSLIPLRERIPIANDGLGMRGLSETDFLLDEETDIDARGGGELEHVAAASNDLDNGDDEDDDDDDYDDDDNDDSVSTASVMSHLRQLSCVMERTPLRTTPSSVQPPKRSPSEDRTKRAGGSQKLAPATPPPTPPVSAQSSKERTNAASTAQKPPPPSLPRGVTARPGRSRTYDQPTISATAKQAGPIFTWNRPSPSGASGNAAAGAEGPSATRGARNKPDDPPTADGSTGADAARKPPLPVARRSSHTGKFGGDQVRGSPKSETRRQPGTSARQSRSAEQSTAEPTDRWLNDDPRILNPSDPVRGFNRNRTSDIGDELSQLAARLQGSEDVSLRSADPRRRGGGRRRGDGGRGGGRRRTAEDDRGGRQQTVEDVYVEAMFLDADGRVSGQSSVAWRQEITRIIDSLRHQLRCRDAATSRTDPGTPRASVLTNADLEVSRNFTPVVVRRESRRSGPVTVRQQSRGPTPVASRRESSNSTSVAARRRNKR